MALHSASAFEKTIRATPREQMMQLRQVGDVDPVLVVVIVVVLHSRDHMSVRVFGKQYGIVLEVACCGSVKSSSW
jgi:hypothetical protein